MTEYEFLGRRQVKVFQCYGRNYLVARAVVFQVRVRFQSGHLGVVGKSGVAVGVVFERIFAVESVKIFVARYAGVRGRNQHEQQYYGGKAPEKDFPYPLRFGIGDNSFGWHVLGSLRRFVRFVVGRIYRTVFFLFVFAHLIVVFCVGRGEL